jgi:formate-dependent phosphoribosylglycinamide formyltransferase (GAR transformylase)
MVRFKLKAINYLGPFDTIEDISNASIDVLVRLNDSYCEQDADFSYCVEIETLSSLSSLIEKSKLKYLVPSAPCIIVDQLTEENIDNAVKAFVR